MNKKTRKGFTIIELVIVIAVIGILTAILIPTFMGITAKAQETENETFVRNINTQLAIEEATEGKNPTMYDAIKAGRTIGFDVEKITPYNGNDIIWDSVNDRFAIVKGDYAQAADATEKRARIVYSDASFDVNTPLYKLWKVYPDAVPDTQNYSIYAKAGWATNVPVSVTVGFDAGDNAIATVTYTGATATEAREIILRTASPASTLNITTYENQVYDPNDNATYQCDNVKVYGVTGSIIINRGGMKSVHLNGNAGYVKLMQGKLVLEDKSTTEVIYKTNIDAIVEKAASAEIDHAHADTQVLAANEGNVVFDWNNDGDLGEAAKHPNTTVTEGQLETSGKEQVQQKLCEHGTTQYVSDGSEGHHLECNICHKVFSAETHTYDAEHANNCIYCSYNANQIETYQVTVDGDADDNGSTLSLAQAIDAYNNASDDEKDYVIELDAGTYLIEPNTYNILQTKGNTGKALVIKAKAGQNAGEYEDVTIKPNINALDTSNKDTKGSQYAFSISGESSFSTGGQINFEGLKFDLGSSDSADAIAKAGGGARLFAVYCQPGANSRYAHNIVMYNCDFFGPGGKLSAAVGANTNNSSPSGITISNCSGDKLNCWFNGYCTNNAGFGLKLINLVSNNFLVVCNNQGSGSLEVVNVDGSFFYGPNGTTTECWLLKIIQPIDLTIENCEWSLLNAPTGGNSSNKPGILFINYDTTEVVDAEIYGLTINRNNFTIPDVHVMTGKKGSININETLTVTNGNGEASFPESVHGPRPEQGE